MIYFFIYLFLEIFVSVEISSVIGPFLTFVEVIVSAVVGLLLLTNFRYTFSQNLHAMMSGEIDPEDFQKNNMASLIGAILLIIPGFLTDIIGILLQFNTFATLLAGKILRKRSNGNVQTNKFNEGDSDVIDVEVIEHDSDHK